MNKTFFLSLRFKKVIEDTVSLVREYNKKISCLNKDDEIDLMTVEMLSQVLDIFDSLPKAVKTYALETYGIANPENFRAFINGYLYNKGECI